MQDVVLKPKTNIFRVLGTVLEIQDPQVLCSGRRVLIQTSKDALPQFKGAIVEIFSTDPTVEKGDHVLVFPRSKGTGFRLTCWKQSTMKILDNIPVEYSLFIGF